METNTLLWFDEGYKLNKLKVLKTVVSLSQIF